MNWAFKVIQGHRYWRRHKSTTGCCHNVQQRRPYFRKLAIASGKLQIRRFQTPHPGLSEKRFRLSRNTLYCQKLESLAYIAADIMGLCMLLFTELLFLKGKRPESKMLAENGF